MENFLWAISATAITGITFVAYRHPDSYAKIWHPNLTFIAKLAVFWGIGISLWELISFIGDTREIIPNVISDYRLNKDIAKGLEEIAAKRSSLINGCKVSGAVGIAGLVSWGYLLLLSRFPELLDLETKERKRSPFDLEEHGGIPPRYRSVRSRDPYHD